MNPKAEAILLQIVRALEKTEWSTGKDWQLTFKADGHIPLIRSVMAEASMDGDKWKDQIEAYITLKISSEDVLWNMVFPVPPSARIRVTMPLTPSASE